MLMPNRRKSAQNCWFFRRAPSSLLSKNAHEWGHRGGFHFFWGGHELILFGTRIVRDLFRINETINGH